jgi:hypothetical protein
MFIRAIIIAIDKEKRIELRGILYGRLPYRS